MLNDLRYALRQLRRHPGFAAVAVLTLALGIGPNTAIFSVVYSVLFRPLPYRAPDELVRPTWTWQPGTGTTDGLTATQYVFWKEHNRVFAGMSGYTNAGAGFNILAHDEPGYVKGQYVAADLFPLLGVSPTQGRQFTVDEDRPGGPAVVIVSAALARRRLGGAAQAVGQTLHVNGVGYTIVGVMPPDFALDGDPVDLWLPMRIEPDPNNQGHNTLTIARLKPDVSLERAQADMGRLLVEIQDAYPGHVTKGELGVTLVPYHDSLVAGFKGVLWLLMGAVGLVLLIATANAAALFLGRAAAREQEFAVRAALGAKAGRSVRPLVVESVLLSVAGGGLGLLFADWSLRGLLALGPQDLPFLDTVRLDTPVLLATAVFAILIGLVAGIPPALRRARRPPQRTLQQSDRALGGARQRARTLLVGGQLALSTALLAGSLLLVTSLRKLWSVDPGFDPTGVWAIQASLPPEQYPTRDRAVQFQEEVRQQLANLPGVTSVATTSSLPLERGLNTWIQAMKDGERVGQVIELRAISPGYFATLGIPLLRGRSVSDADRSGDPSVVVVNQRLAERYWPDRSPIGESIWLGSETAQVVGVAADVKEFGLDAVVPRILYVPAAQVPNGLAASMRRWFLASWLVKARIAPSAEVVRRTVAAINPQQPIVSIRPFHEVIASSVASRRFIGLLLNLFATLALVLAAVGVYGVVSYAVSQRRRELGLRAALGARRVELTALVMRQGLRLAAAGTLTGLVLALFGTRFLRGYVFGISPDNPIVLGTACLGLALIALLACYVPARRAARADPMEALRYE